MRGTIEILRQGYIRRRDAAKANIGKRRISLPIVPPPQEHHGFLDPDIERRFQKLCEETKKGMLGE